MTILCIMDGYGLSSETEFNAIAKAKKPNLDMIFDKYNQVTANASGLYVGLPDGQMGNSEVGHLNIGAGRIVYQDLTKITKMIGDGDFFKNDKLQIAFKHAKDNNSAIHFIGLLSDGGVHSHNTHLYALLEMAKKQNIDKVYVHCFMDGRDTDPKSGAKFIEELESEIKKISVGKIATVTGRYYAMDRDKNYDRVKLAYDAMTIGTKEFNNSALDAVNKSYNNDKTDEFVIPIGIANNEDELKDSRIKNNDSIVFFNFRPDRAREITRTFVDSDFQFFNRKKLDNLCFVCFTDYDESIKEKLVAFPKEEINDTLGEVVSKSGLNQIRIAETEKYAHVTFFMNGGVEVPYKNEERVLVPSPKEVPTYDLKPEMSAYQVCDKVLEAIDSNKYELIIVNFANPDMVGHTGVMEAAVKAIEVVDECVGKIYKKIENTDNYMFICADHGNAEKMRDENGQPFTAHTSNKVPFVLINNKGYKLADNGSLCDIAPTLLTVMGISIPKVMTGKSLLIQ